jgi:hypothetical protein
LSALLYASHDVFSRFSDFGAGQRGQVEERETVGGRIRKVWTRRGWRREAPTTRRPAHR